MTLSEHDLTKEFPQLSSRLKALDESDPKFHSAYTRYQEVDKEIIHFETEANCSDIHLEDLKKKRLQLKDKLYFMLTRS